MAWSTWGGHTGAAQQMQLGTGRRRGLVPLVNAAMRQIEIGVAVEDEAIGAWITAPTPPPSAAAPARPVYPKLKPPLQDQQSIKWAHCWVD